ncbi:uncharacterized protein KGF55_003726 [Candida pseudojiufengensis]|uniref:uncharacterized protein n=1 Tax=Candida pseudojiufengensis TaxID=497109 RepID=UPI0022250D11|nr:uncharacterized protein KGF55_003726 [Candida pseudojiufengensis]KAI5962650.1 hypothetical protein KGF55_003726 [Candida pseudojiufengensis]
MLTILLDMVGKELIEKNCNSKIGSFEIEKNSNLPSMYYELIIDVIQLHVLKSIIQILLESQKMILIKGSIEDSFNLKGIYIGFGLIKVMNSDPEEICKAMSKTSRHESLFDTTPLYSAPRELIKPLDTHKSETFPKNDSQNNFVERKFNLNSTQVTKILGKNGQTLNSIRLQSKCWINVENPLILEHQYRRKDVMQTITIGGTPSNVQIVLDELMQLLKSFAKTG